MIPYGRQSILDADIAAVSAVLRSDYLTQGPVVPRFEDAVAARVGALHAVAANSATSALHIACMALGLGPGDVLWTSPITFVASSNSALYCGAQVDFVDIDRDTCNMSVAALAEKLRDAQALGKLPKVVMPVHFSGEPCDMAAIAELAREYGFAIIEDASHAVGGKYRGVSIGACKHSDITVFSFHPVKIITTAEGGLATTNDPILAQRMALLRSHGVTREPELMNRQPDGPWYYQQVALGYNYRMTDIAAALGVSQMERLDAFLEQRHQLAQRYDRLLASLPVVLPARDTNNYSALHLYVIRLVDASEEKRLAVFERMRQAGVGVNVHYIPVHLQPFYEALGFRSGQFPEAESYYRQAITLPLFPDLSEVDQEKVVTALAEALA